MSYNVNDNKDMKKNCRFYIVFILFSIKNFRIFAAIYGADEA